jgi:hypothetical protein
MINNQPTAIDRIREALDEIEQCADMSLRDYNSQHPDDTISADIALEETIDGGLIDIADGDLPMLRPADAESLLDLITAISR